MTNRFLTHGMHICNALQVVIPCLNILQLARKITLWRFKTLPESSGIGLEFIKQVMQLTKTVCATFCTLILIKEQSIGI